ncbi:hypothetical protein AB0K16_51205 [Nonomuraea jabiensis]|uniref:hypothetical protein n=1 Tax=Nonomuraea jabiensis TaxID=882448 RepID=UPI0034353B1C
MSSKRKRNIRRIMASTGLNYTRAAEIDRQSRASANSKRRRRALTIEEIIKAISPSIHDSLMPQTRIAKLVKDLGPAMPDYSKLLGPVLADYAKVAMPNLAEMAKTLRQLDPAIKANLAPSCAIAQASKALAHVNSGLSKEVYNSLMPQTRIANLVKDLGPVMPDYSKLLRRDPRL